MDELVDDVFAKLEELGLLDNTYVIYTTDNGYHIGNHRLNAGKTTCYEEDVNIPFYIRGPGIAEGKMVHYPTTHTDVMPTIFELAGIPLRPEFDGAPMPVTEGIPPKKYEHVNIEFWGVNLEEGEYSSGMLATRPGLLGCTWNYWQQLDGTLIGGLNTSYLHKRYLQSAPRYWKRLRPHVRNMVYQRA